MHKNEKRIQGLELNELGAGRDTCRQRCAGPGGYCTFRVVALGDTVNVSHAGTSGVFTLGTSGNGCTDKNDMEKGSTLILVHSEGGWLPSRPLCQAVQHFPHGAMRVLKGMVVAVMWFADCVISARILARSHGVPVVPAALAMFFFTALLLLAAYVLARCTKKSRN